MGKDVKGMTGVAAWGRVTGYSAAHFLVDLACALLMFGTVRCAPDWYMCLLLYNFCAFAMQMPLGVLADRWSRNAFFAAIGCLLVAGAYGIGAFPIAAAVVAGIGNGMFHVGGGIDVLNISTERSSALGVFVSPGAFGIFLGTLWGKGAAVPTMPVVAALVLFAFLLFAIGLLHKSWPKNMPFSLEAERQPGMAAIALCLFLVVCVRSYAGFAMQFPWKAGAWSVILTCAVVLGKALGGFAADGLGMRRAAAFSLGASAVLFLLSARPVFGVLAVLLFNMTMPITLGAIARIFPGAKGFSFGMLTFALFLGFLPFYRGVGSLCLTGWGLSLLSLLSLVLLWAGLRKARA